MCTARASRRDRLGEPALHGLGRVAGIGVEGELRLGCLGMDGVDQGLEQRGLAGEEADAGADHHAVEAPGGEPHAHRHFGRLAVVDGAELGVVAEALEPGDVGVDAGLDLGRVEAGIVGELRAGEVDDRRLEADEEDAHLGHDGISENTPCGRDAPRTVNRLPTTHPPGGRSTPRAGVGLRWVPRFNRAREPISMALADACLIATTVASAAATFWLLARAAADLMSGVPPSKRTFETGWIRDPRYRLQLVALALVAVSLALPAAHLGHVDAGVRQATSTFNSQSLMGVVVAETIESRSKWMSAGIAAYVVLLFINGSMLFG